MQRDESGESSPENGVSKSQRKREMHDLQALGERLVALSDTQLQTLSLPEGLHDAVCEARHTTRHEARRRQMQFIGRLMRSVDAAPIRDKLREWDGQSHEATALQHRLERWRERLMDDDGALAEYVAAYRPAQPGIDIQRLRTLIRNARDERVRGKAPRHFRELFRELKRIANDGAVTGDA